MSETKTRPTPVGLDSYSKEDLSLRDAMMREEAYEAPAEPTPAPEPKARQPRVEPAPEPAVVIETADDAEPGDAEPAEPAEPGTVPHQKFHAERERRKAAEAKAAEAQRKADVEMARATERYNLLMEAVKSATTPPEPAAQPAAQIPDAAVDPIGHFKALHEQTQRDLAAQRAIVEGFQQQQRQAQEIHALRSWAASVEVPFQQANPDYPAAMDFLKQSRRGELTDLGVSPDQIEGIINNDVTVIAQTARQQGKNFAEQLYNAAKRRGYAKAAPAAAAPAIPALDAEPASDAATAATTRQQRGRDSATTIGAAGTAPAVSLSPEKIANMSEREFTKLYDRLKGDPKALRDLMGH